MGKYMVTLFVVCSVIIACKACTSGWESYDRSCYKYFADRKNWSDAKRYCETQGAHLAIVLSNEENVFLKALLRRSHIGSSDQVWMDGDDLKSEHNFVWENTGQGFEITDWGPNEPNQSGGNEDCLSFFALYDFKWNDEHCDSAFGFLCEKEAVGTGGVIG
ncbi:lectin-like [Mercenaria mercenaria]|uniref:lectin-like n=1 Tax=Mercenaria mercenaria TaxID=6596 RepID=UPI00234F7D22|nr:lectin-like [Mercenaria mercenaria]